MKAKVSKSARDPATMAMHRGWKAASILVLVACGCIVPVGGFCVTPNVIVSRDWAARRPPPPAGDISELVCQHRPLWPPIPLHQNTGLYTHGPLRFF